MSPDDPALRLVAFHEAGHAVAFLHIGYTIRGMNLDSADGFTDPADQNAHEHPDFPFVLYAGPWAQAFGKSGAWDAPSFDDVQVEMQSNLSDWRAYEGLMSGGDVDKVDQVEVALLDAHYEHRDQSGIVYPPIAQPLPAWIHELEGLAPRIKQLAEELQNAESKSLSHFDFLDGEMTLFRVLPRLWRMA